MVLPQFTAPEHVVEQLPRIPEIIRDAPHVGIGFIMPCLFDQRRSRRQGEHDVPAALFNRMLQHFDLMRRRIRMFHVQIGIADIIAFDKIHTPLCVQRHDGIVIFLCARLSHTDAVHVGIPLTDRRRIRYIARQRVASQNRQMPVCRFPRNSPHDMDSKL